MAKKRSRGAEVYWYDFWLNSATGAEKEKLESLDKDQISQINEMQRKGKKYWDILGIGKGGKKETRGRKPGKSQKTTQQNDLNLSQKTIGKLIVHYISTTKDTDEIKAKYLGISQTEYHALITQMLSLGLLRIADLSKALSSGAVTVSE